MKPITGNANITLPLQVAAVTPAPVKRTTGASATLNNDGQRPLCWIRRVRRQHEVCHFE